MTNRKTDRGGAKSNFSFFVLYFSLLLMLTSGVLADFSRDNSTGIVTDNTTGLEWQDDTTGSQMKWTDAVSYCENLTLGDHSDWRLPNLNELTSLVDDTQYRPAIDHSATAFQHTLSSHYWSSTSYAVYASFAWLVYFGNGNQYYDVKSSSFYVCCVRAGEN